MRFPAMPERAPSKRAARSAGQTTARFLPPDPELWLAACKLLSAYVRRQGEGRKSI